MKNTANEVYADVKEIRTAADNIREETESYSQNLKKLEVCIDELKGFWSGDASEAFARSMSAQITQLKGVEASLRKLSEDYRSVADEYARNDQRTEEIISAIKCI